MKKIIIFCTLWFAACYQVTMAQTTTINGLTILMSYPDLAFGTSSDSMALMMNQTGFNGWHCVGSVKDFYTSQSNGKVLLNSQIVRVTMPQNAAYYHDGGIGGNDIVPHVVAEINKQYPAGFQNLSTSPNREKGGLWFFNLITNYSARSFSFDFSDKFVLNNGQSFEITGGSLTFLGIGNKPATNTMCHELGHSLFAWTDYYHDDIPGMTNLGHYCLMSSGGSTTSPMPIDPGLRFLNNWIPNVVDITNSTTQVYTAISNDYSKVYKYTNLNNRKEYLLIESHIHGGYYAAVDGEGIPVDEGLEIWYVDEDGGVDGPLSKQYPRIKLLQADGLDELGNSSASHSDQRGDLTDLFDNTYPTFSDASFPFRWKNGDETGLIITNISAPGTSMTFKVNARANTILAKVGNNGSIIPGGYVNVATGSSKTFTIVPDPGYEVDQVWVGGVTKGVLSSYTFSSVSKSDSIRVSFKVSTTNSLPAPWLKATIGNTGTVGVSGYRNGVFGITSYGSDIFWTNDSFDYLYQTLNGNGTIVARVAKANNPQVWSKYGVMIRETLSDDSKHIMLVKTPGAGIAPQSRTATTGATDHNPNNTANLDTIVKAAWLKITRSGNMFNSYYSYDGAAWILTESITINMQSNVTIGLCATAATANTPVKVSFDNVTVTGSPSSNLLTKYGVPRSTALPNLVQNYTHVYVLGTGGPNLSNVTNAQFNWSLSNNGLYQFSFQTNNGVPSWYTNHTCTNTLNQTAPSITIIASAFAGLSGTYYVNIDNSGNLVLVHQSGAYALYFSNSATAPAREAAVEAEEGSLSSYPNPFVEATYLSIPDGMGALDMVVTAADGSVVEQGSISEGTAIGAAYEAGVYLVRLKNDHFTQTLKLIKQ